MIVMKFGGTSVQDAKAIERAGAIVKGRLEQKPVVVVSAMAKVTDQLLAMARAAGAGDRKTALKLCRALQERHYNTAGELLGTALFTQFHSDLGADFETLEELLRGISAVGELTPRTTDYVSAFGEILSSKIVAAAFSALGMPSALVDSREWLLPSSKKATKDCSRKWRPWSRPAKYRSWEASSARPRPESPPPSAAVGQTILPLSPAPAWEPNASRYGQMWMA
jgi:aspartokinase